MNRSTLRSVLLALIVFSLSIIQAFSQNSSDASTAADRYLSIRTEMGDFSGAVLIARDGKILLRKGYGFADIEKPKPYSPETRHEVASVSKMFTAAAIVKLREMGRLTLDDGICKYIDNCPEIWRPITIRQLMDHTSGIPDYESKLGLGSQKYLDFMQKPGASRQIAEDARSQALDFKPGTGFNYSNTGYILLGQIVEKASGEPFARFVERKLLRSAGMTHSGVIDSARLPAGLAAGYTHAELSWDDVVRGRPLTDGHLKRVPQLSLTSPEGDAFLYSTVDDIYKWTQVMTGEKHGVLTAADISEILTPNSSGYGYGWFVGKGFDRPRFRHNGMLPGYVTDVVVFPKDKVTLIFFSNMDRSRMQSITRDLSAIALGVPHDVPVRGKVVSLSNEQLNRLEGTFLMKDGKKLTIRRKNNDSLLTAELEGRYSAVLVPLSEHEFYFPLGDGIATFTFDNDGRARSVNIHYSAEDHIAVRPNSP